LLNADILVKCPVLGLSWTCHGPSQACLEHVLDLLGPVLGCLGPILGHLSPALGLSWTILAPSWLILAPSWASWPRSRKRPQKGPQKLAGSNRFWGPFWGHFGVLFGTIFWIDFLAVFGPLLDHFWAPFGSIMGPRSALGAPRRLPENPPELQSSKKLSFKNNKKPSVF
jgi:hypothetical protein